MHEEIRSAFSGLCGRCILTASVGTYVETLLISASLSTISPMCCSIEIGDPNHTTLNKEEHVRIVIESCIAKPKALVNHWRSHDRY